jgi:post-segregation antitoxin (ccd killing protein)
MTDVTTLAIPKSLIEKAKQNNINCSEVSRKALQEEVDRKEAAKVKEILEAPKTE